MGVIRLIQRELQCRVNKTFDVYKKDTTTNKKEQVFFFFLN